MVAYPASSLPLETLLSAPPMLASSSASTIGTGAGAASNEGRYKKHPPAVGDIYMVRDLEHICALHLQSQAGGSGDGGGGGGSAVSAGGVLGVHLDFTDSLQACSVVRATLVMSETRRDGTRVQVMLVTVPNSFKWMIILKVINVFHVLTFITLSGQLGQSSEQGRTKRCGR